ncbi:MAG: hydroxymethylglutaryl-CoA lyase [Chloroflexi bacterium]|nr:hydroxymethylglutaryl-CoA lyase [Chloroflexota bacterium]
MTFDPNNFKRAMSQFASGVTVVTTKHGDTPIGITASSFTSLSMDPPLVLVSLSKKLFTHNVIADSGIFAVNVLSARQLDLGMRFAGMMPEIKDRFAGLNTRTAATGSPLLPDSLAWVDCTVWASYDGGDHTIFVGEVKDLDVSDYDTPLLYHNRLWRRSEALEVPTVPLEAKLVEVGMRDGIQREKEFIPTKVKAEYVTALADAGLKEIQVASFVHPKIVPQMADAEDLLALLPKRDDVIYSGLVLNMRGVDRAISAGVDKVDMGVPASETLAKMNANTTIEDGLKEMEAMVKKARAHNVKVRAGVQVAFGCTFEGKIDTGKVVSMARRFLSMGIDELSLADSAGLANPQLIRRTVQEILPLAGDVPLVLHLHDTRGQGIANLLSALKSGVTAFDTSLGGLGGCPFITTAKGNIATEDSAFMLHEMGIQTGIDIEKVATLSRNMEKMLGKGLPAKMHHILKGDE